MAAWHRSEERDSGRRLSRFAHPAGEQDVSSRKIRFGLWYDFRNPARWRQPADRLYGEILDQIAWSENNGFDDVWLSEHHFIDDGYLPSILPAAAAIAARTKRIRIASGVLLMPFHNPIRLARISRPST
jgi:alkanesulfonate monooxygenase SsuD/methylene tetrahydromethanopterin reductase-like flavin-dependent oxidoreductase (luciferase family)